LKKSKSESESLKQILESLSGVVDRISVGETNHSLVAIVDVLIETVQSLDQATIDLLAGAQAQVAEFGEELERLQSNPNSEVSVPITEIEAELQRREEARSKVVDIQEELENQRDEMVTRLETLHLLLGNETGRNATTLKTEKTNLDTKLQSLNKTVESLIKSVAENDRETEMLVAYRNAIKLLSTGLPSNIIGKNIKFSK
jgi:hypothetical protein